MNFVVWPFSARARQLKLENPMGKFEKTHIFANFCTFWTIFIHFEATSDFSNKIISIQGTVRSSVLNENLISFPFTALVLFTLMQAFWWNNLYVYLYGFNSVLLFVESLTIPAWIWIFFEIKRQATYESIPSDSEQQPINVQSQC